MDPRLRMHLASLTHPSRSQFSFLSSDWPSLARSLHWVCNTRKFNQSDTCNFFSWCGRGKVILLLDVKFGALANLLQEKTCSGSQPISALKKTLSSRGQVVQVPNVTWWGKLHDHSGVFTSFLPTNYIFHPIDLNIYSTNCLGQRWQNPWKDTWLLRWSLKCRVQIHFHQCTILYLKIPCLGSLIPQAESQNGEIHGKNMPLLTSKKIDREILCVPLQWWNSS